MNSKHVEDLIDLALAEDLSAGDPTTESLIAADSTGAAEIVSRQAGVLAGIDTALAVFSRIDPSLEVRPLKRTARRWSRATRWQGSRAPWRRY